MQLEPEPQSAPAADPVGREPAREAEVVQQPESLRAIAALATELNIPAASGEFFARIVASIPATTTARLLDQALLAESTEELADLVTRLGVNGGFPLAAGFSSARLKPGQKAYQQGWQMGFVLKQHGWALITGGGPGGMKAISRGADGGNLFSATIELPFEKDKVTGADDPRRLEFKHFHTRKRALVDRPQAFFVIEGGFGTLDELFEALCLIQTGKRPIAPVALIERPGSGFWTRTLAELSHRFVEAGVVSPNDDALYAIFDNVDDAAAHILGFYRIFHSVSVDSDAETLTIRLQSGKRLDESFLQSETVKRLVRGLTDGRNEVLELAAPTAQQIESEPLETIALPHYRIEQFNQRSYATLRELIDLVNGVERQRAPIVSNPLVMYTEALVSLAQLDEFTPVGLAVLQADLFLSAARAVARDRRDLEATVMRARMTAVKSHVSKAVLAQALSQIAYDHDHSAHALRLLESAQGDLSVVAANPQPVEPEFDLLVGAIAVTAARIELRRGDLDAAATHIETAQMSMGADQAEPSLKFRHALAVASGLRHHLRGAHVEAAAALSAAIANNPDGPYDGPDAHTVWTALTRSLIAHGERNEAVRLLDAYTSALVSAREEALPHGILDAELSVRIGSTLLEKAVALGAGTPGAEPSVDALLDSALNYLEPAVQHSDLVGRMVEIARVRVYQGRPDALDPLVAEVSRAAKDDGRRYEVARRDDGSIEVTNTNSSRAWRAKHRLRLRAAIVTLGDTLLELHGAHLSPEDATHIIDVRNGSARAVAERLQAGELNVNEQRPQSLGLRI
ncbi:MAG: LOG family protein [Acidimicrobiia bacterium]